MYHGAMGLRAYDIPAIKDLDADQRRQVARDCVRSGSPFEETWSKKQWSEHLGLGEGVRSDVGVDDLIQAGMLKRNKVSGVFKTTHMCSQYASSVNAPRYTTEQADEAVQLLAHRLEESGGLIDGVQVRRVVLYGSVLRDLKPGETHTVGDIDYALELEGIDSNTWASAAAKVGEYLSQGDDRLMPSGSLHEVSFSIQRQREDDRSGAVELWVKPGLRPLPKAPEGSPKNIQPQDFPIPEVPTSLTLPVSQADLSAIERQQEVAVRTHSRAATIAGQAEKWTQRPEVPTIDESSTYADRLQNFRVAHLDPQRSTPVNQKHLRMGGK